ncbi:MAG: hypothetical protein J3K34DRAFT_398051 [Monoraphidium minutum]|nr:MAG: hypothetical protein J3K34DRAFT_398051 [Monoraphidium minutum]
MRAASLQQCSSRGVARAAPRVQRRAVVVAQAASTNGAAPAKKPAKAPGASGPFTNINRFKVQPEAVGHFEAEWRGREAAMAKFGGFQGFKLEREGEQWVARSTWASIPEWEAWSLSPECRRSHLPLGVWQYVPAKGEGFPEDFVFIVDYDRPIDAKYPASGAAAL